MRMRALPSKCMASRRKPSRTIRRCSISSFWKTRSNIHASSRIDYTAQSGRMPEGPMRILFLNYTFPGPLGTMAASLAALPGNEVLFASEYGRRDFSLPGVKRVLLKKPKDRKKAVASISTPALDAGERDWTMAYLRGRPRLRRSWACLRKGLSPTW